jgi:large subunit ribosomal protein L17
MRHNVFGKKLSRSKNERRRLLQSLAREMIVHGGIVTTISKARAVRPLIERLVTNAKKNSEAGRSEVRKVLSDRISAQIIIDNSKERFGDRNGGYTRTVKLYNRKSDNTEMVRIEFVDITVGKELAPNLEISDKSQVKVKSEVKDVKKISKLKKTEIKKDKKTTKIKK